MFEDSEENEALRREIIDAAKARGAEIPCSGGRHMPVVNYKKGRVVERVYCTLCGQRFYEAPREKKDEEEE